MEAVSIKEILDNLRIQICRKAIRWVSVPNHSTLQFSGNAPQSFAKVGLSVADKIRKTLFLYLAELKPNHKAFRKDKDMENLSRFSYQQQGVPIMELRDKNPFRRFRQLSLCNILHFTMCLL